jgi:hypothetical protein
VLEFLREVEAEVDRLKLRIEEYREQIVNEGAETLNYPRRTRAAMLRASLDVTAILARLRRGKLWE